MRSLPLPLQRFICAFLFLCVVKIGSGQPQQLKLSDFAIWGGSAPASPYNSAQGIVFNNTATIQGNIGTNHLINVKNNLLVTGNIYSGNLISFNNNAKVTGNIFANRAGTTSNPAIGFASRDTIIGNLTGNGKITFGTYGQVIGSVAVPAPTNTNYTGPAPSAGFTNILNLPLMPVMPANSPFDNKIGTTVISNTQALSPGVYKTLALTGSKTITFAGPGNYIFQQVDNGTTTNKFIFDFQGSSGDAINIYVIKDARWGLLSVSMVNGNDPSRIYTEVHGNGSTFGGSSFVLQGPTSIPAGSNLWLGNVWAPNGIISITSVPILPAGASHIIGALWSGKQVNIKNDIKITYVPAAAGPNFNAVTPYYPAPTNGKVAPASNTVGAELTSLAQNSASIKSIPNNNIFILDTTTGKVLIQVLFKNADYLTVKTRLTNAGMTGMSDKGPQSVVITGNIPISNLGTLNNGGVNNPDGKITEVYPMYPPISNTGLITTQGDATMRSNAVRSRFLINGTGQRIDGTGIKIGVISDSYDEVSPGIAAQADVNEGDLPGIKSDGTLNANPNPVQVLQDYIGGHDEGRAMLQIVADIAPAAKLAFCTGSLSPDGFASAIQQLSSDNLPGGKCDVIVDDITYITEPFFNDGIIAQAVDTAVKHGVTYFSAAGNFGQLSYEGVFKGVTDTSVIQPGQIHNFASSGTNYYQSVRLAPGSYTIVLQWADNFSSSGGTGATTDLDLYIVGSNGFKLFGFNRNSLGGDPVEVCPLTVTDTTNAKIMVVRTAGNTNVRFKYIIFRGGASLLNFQTGTSTIVGHPDADSAIAVGAMLYANFPQFTPVWPGVASFSSRGGTSIVNGNTTSAPRNKPDIIAPNGVNTSVDLHGPQFNDGDTYPNFFGTSAAAPHAAAVAGLLIQARRAFNLETTVKPSDVRKQLLTSAGKFSYLSNNFSYEGGYGYVQADSAMLQIANARPVISTLAPVIPGAQNDTLPFQVTITGKYFTSSTKIYVSNIPYPTTVSINTSTGVGTATATVPAIPHGQDPPFQVFNAAKSPSGLDGGLSEALHFFSSGIRVVVKADDKSRRYGQLNPTLTASVTIINGLDSLPLSQTALTLASLKLDNLTFTTNAVPYSSPRSYGISVARTTPLQPNDTLLTKYAFEFDPGTLTVEKMPLKITPNYTTARYGDDISGITYSYQFDTSGVLDPNLMNDVTSLYSQYRSDNALIVLNGFSTQNPPFTVADLDTMSTLASFQSMLNARKFIVQNGQLTPLAGNVSADQIGQERYLIDVSAQSLQNFKLNSSQATMVPALDNVHARALLNIKALTSGNAMAATPGNSLQPMINGQLLAMVNGQIQTPVDSLFTAVVNGVSQPAGDVIFENGQLQALVNGIYLPASSAEIIATTSAQRVTVDLSVSNGQLQALVNGQPMTVVNGQLQALVNGQLLALVNGQLKALVNANLTPLVNGQLMAIVNGQLQAMVNGQVVAIVNGQLMALVNGQLQIVQDLSFSNGQLQALVNGQLQALVNGQLKALVNGVVTDVPTTSFNIVNGQLQALVNGQTVAYVNGQLKALVNGQLQALVNGAAVQTNSVIQLANGQLQALVNGTYIPIANGQLQALVNGQLLAMVNGQLMALVNGELDFVVFENGQLQALVNGQLQALVNGQLKAMVNGQLVQVNSYTITNGQLQALVNGQTWSYPNGQLKALVNGQLQALVNNFDVGGTYNNTKTAVVVDEDDINQQSGDLGGMFAVNMITALDVGYQYLIPAAFVNENFEVTYGPGQVLITKRPLTISADYKTKNAGDANPPLTVSYDGFAFGETPSVLCQPVVSPPPYIDQVERRTTYTNVQINGQGNVYTATPGETLTLTGNWSEQHFASFVPNYVVYCPGCITQNYVGLTNDNFTGNIFDTCFDVSGLGSFSGTLNNTFTAPTRPGVYYVTQNSTFWYYCYQFGHLLQDQFGQASIALIYVNPHDGVTANTTATDQSAAGNYPIVVGGCYFDQNYRIIFKDDTLVVAPGSIMTHAALQPETSITKGSRLYPNPASTMVRLELKDALQGTDNLQVFDATGKLTTTLSRRIGEGSYEINIARLLPGVYFVEAKTVHGTETFKFIKK